MRLCMPTNGDGGMNELVHNHFGSAGYFTVYDTELKSLSILKNSNDHHEHGHCNPLEQISQFNIDAVLTKGMGRRAVQKLNSGGVKVFLINGITVEEAIKEFETSNLNELTLQNACGGHAHGVH